MQLFRALKYPNYRLFFVGQSISLIGTWMQHVAMAWLVYQLTHSAFWLGVMGFAGHIPYLLFSPLAGVLADRWNRYRILYLTQILSLVQAIFLALLTLTGVIQLWHLIALVFVLGSINAFDIPTRQSFFVELVGNKKDLGNAIALNSSMFNFARLVGPALAGIVIAVAGEGICFLINATTFLPILLALSLMKVSKQKKKLSPAPVWHSFQAGFRYIFGFPPLRSILFLMGFVGFIGMPFTVLFPVFASEILGAGPKTYGFLVASAGVGALVGALTMASRKNVLGLEKLIALCCCLFGLGLMAFAYSKFLVLSVLILFFVGFALMIQMSSTNIVFQTIVEDDKRGRLMSFYSISIIGTSPFGHLLIGALASKMGAPLTLSLCGFAIFVAALLFAKKLPMLKKKMHPVYVKMGILPEVASGIQTATNLTTPPED